MFALFRSRASLWLESSTDLAAVENEDEDEDDGSGLPVCPGFVQLWRGAMGGAFFEGWAVTEAVKAFAAAGRRPDLYFWRSHDGLEVDLLIGAGGKFIPVEIKQTATPLPGHAQGLLRLKELLGKEGGAPLLLCGVAQATPLPHGVIALPWREFPEWIRSIK